MFKSKKKKKEKKELCIFTLFNKKTVTNPPLYSSQTHKSKSNPFIYEYFVFKSFIITVHVGRKKKVFFIYKAAN